MFFKNLNLLNGQPKLAVLIDPDRHTDATLQQLAALAVNSRVDVFLVGSSLLLQNRFEATIAYLKQHTAIPVVIFPGNNYQISAQADAILLLSLISGRNAEYLIGQHVTAATAIKQAGIEVLPTGYMLIDGGRTSTTSYITQTLPIPNDKPDVAVATALAGEQLGLKLIYLEAGSGAHSTVNPQLVKAVKQQVSLPVIVGGGIRTAAQAEQLCLAGADMLVVGNVLEKDPEVLLEISLAVHSVRPIPPTVV